jgi:hypothetical protein
MSRLDIYVSADCPGCARAREIAVSLEGEARGVSIEVIDLEGVAPERLPDGVIAVPAYVLDGTVISLGNPRLSSLRERLARAGGSQGAE